MSTISIIFKECQEMCKETPEYEIEGTHNESNL